MLLGHGFQPLGLRSQQCRRQIGQHHLAQGPTNEQNKQGTEEVKRPDSTWVAIDRILGIFTSIVLLSVAYRFERDQRQTIDAQAKAIRKLLKERQVDVN